MWVLRHFGNLAGFLPHEVGEEDDEGLAPPPAAHTFLKQEGRVGVTGYKPPISYFDALNQFLKGSLSTGVFVMGYAFSHSGIIGGCVISVVMFPIMLNSVQDLSKVAKRVADRELGDVRPSLPETVQYTMERGPECLAKHAHTFGTCTLVFVVICELGASCVCYSLIATHLQLVLNHTVKLGMSIYAIYALLFPPVLLVSMVGSMKMVTPIALFGNILMATAIFFYMLVVVSELEDINNRPYFLGFKRLPICIGYYIYSMEGSSYVLSIKNEMKNPEKFDSILGVVNVGVTITSLVNFFMGFLSYWRYGNETKGTSLENLDQEDQLVQGMDILVAAASLCGYSFHMYIPFDHTFPKFHDKYGPFKHRKMTLFSYRTIAVIITFVLAAIIPDLTSLIYLNGSLLGGLLMVTPNILYLVEFRHTITWISIVINLFSISIGLSFMAIGTYESIRGMVIHLYSLR